MIVGVLLMQYSNLPRPIDSKGRKRKRNKLGNEGQENQRRAN
jgi:hypothetical protein